MRIHASHKIFHLASLPASHRPPLATSSPLCAELRSNVVGMLRRCRKAEIRFVFVRLFRRFSVTRAVRILSTPILFLGVHQCLPTITPPSVLVLFPIRCPSQTTMSVTAFEAAGTRQEGKRMKKEKKNRFKRRRHCACVRGGGRGTETAEETKRG